uniref:Uncharacterized mitochondrial protein AtMg00810-like n=1 Tax=Nicotiana tabacum TaxID=4097 RepID=A0A1S4CG01_TOBAC|nr:PREDICTED: uncharacterized mitochondrial protein AtMg00810-like [Nicotiana tabacum]
MDFIQSHYDYSLFTKRIGADLVVILVYVDDLLVTGSKLLLIQQVRKDLQEKLKMKDLGELKYFLVIEFSRYQKVKDNDSEDVQLEENRNYQRLVGRLLYLTMTRPYIAFVVQVLSQYMHAPKRRVVRYIKSTPGLDLFMPTGSCNKLIAYCDSDWGACVESRRLVTGYVVKFGDALISWKSKKQGIVSRSSAEAEFRRMATTVTEIVWLVGLFKELGMDIALPVTARQQSKLLHI